jgi:hypothetical protein
MGSQDRNKPCPRRTQAFRILPSITVSWVLPALNYLRILINWKIKSIKPAIRYHQANQNIESLPIKYGRHAMNRQSCFRHPSYSRSMTRPTQDTVKYSINRSTPFQRTSDSTMGYPLQAIYGRRFEHERIRPFPSPSTAWRSYCP